MYEVRACATCCDYDELVQTVRANGPGRLAANCEEEARGLRHQWLRTMSSIVTMHAVDLALVWCDDTSLYIEPSHSGSSLDEVCDDHRTHDMVLVYCAVSIFEYRTVLLYQ